MTDKHYNNITNALNNVAKRSFLSISDKWRSIYNTDSTLIDLPVEQNGKIPEKLRKMEILPTPTPTPTPTPIKYMEEIYG